MPTAHRKIGRRNRVAVCPLVNKTISVTIDTAWYMHCARAKYRVNWSAECERMILEYIDQLEKRE